MRNLLTRRRRNWALSLFAAAAVATPLLAGPTASQPVDVPSPRSADLRLAAATSQWEVWQVPQAPNVANPSNPLADRLWGVYDGPQDQVSEPYQNATGTRKQLIGKIALRPRVKWFGNHNADNEIADKVRSYIADSQDGDPSKLVALAVFRMEPWEHDACARPSTAAEKASYKRWITNLAAGIGTTPTLVWLQPDAPFLWCAPDRRAKSALFTFATKTLSALPNTSVYIDAGAADWCENGHMATASRCAGLLKLMGVRYARGFAMDSTHYNGPAANIALGSQIVDVLERDGYGPKHFVVDTAKSGRPMTWAEVIPAERGGLKDNARVCTTTTMRHCVTLGIPPTVDVASSRWGMSSSIQQLAARNVDAFVWAGRPWLYNQADPFVASRALAMAGTTPWPGPRYGTPPLG